MELRPVGTDDRIWQGDVLVGHLDTVGNISAGAGFTFDLNADTITVTGTLVGAGIGGSPGGADTNIQFNDGGSFAGDSTFTFNDASKLVTANALTLATGDLTLTAGNIILADESWIGTSSGNAWLFDTAGDITTTANLGVGTTAPPYRFSVASPNGSGVVGMYHDNSNPWIKWKVGSQLILQRDEVGQTNVFIQGSAGQSAAMRIYQTPGGNYMGFATVSGIGYLSVSGSPVGLRFDTAANGQYVSCFHGCVEGRTKLFQVTGYRTGDARRFLSLSVGKDAADTASFDGLSNYWFDGTIKSTGGAQLGDGGTTNYTDFESDGSPIFVGTAGLPFAGISGFDTSTTVTIAGSGIANKVQVVAFDTNDPSNNMTPDHTNDHITVTKAGMYLCTVSVTIESATGTGYTAAAGVFKNNGATHFTNLHFHRSLAGGGGDIGSASMSGLVDLAANDTIEVWVWNETNTTNMIVDDITMSLVQVGGT